jgi:hypothetical protein
MQERSICGECCGWSGRGIDRRDGKNPMVRDFRGSLLSLPSAVLCPALTWPKGACSSTNPQGAAGRPHPSLVPGSGLLMPGETQYNTPSAACPAETIEAPPDLTPILKTGEIQLPSAVLFSDRCLKTLRNPTSSAQA